MKSAPPPWVEGLLSPTISDFADDYLTKAYLLFLLSTKHMQDLPDCAARPASKLGAPGHELLVLAELGPQAMPVPKINVRIS